MGWGRGLYRNMGGQLREGSHTHSRGPQRPPMDTPTHRYVRRQPAHTCASGTCPAPLHPEHIILVGVWTVVLGTLGLVGRVSRQTRPPQDCLGSSGLSLCLSAGLSHGAPHPVEMASEPRPESGFQGSWAGDWGFQGCRTGVHPCSGNLTSEGSQNRGWGGLRWAPVECPIRPQDLAQSGTELWP